MGPEGNWHPAAADSWEQVEVPFARDGMYYKEFPVMFDWMHNGAGFSVFFLQPLSDPDNLEMRRRMERFAGFYMGTDPQADNYDTAHRVIRSMFNGSRGPLMRKSTGLDWAGDSIEVEGRFKPGHGERNYAEIVAHFEDYNDVVGDHPLNLSTTTLAFNAFMLSGDAAYKDWLVNDVDAWCERTAANDGIIPTNIGLDGSLGGACDGKWYGGVYGWGFSVTVPQTGALAHRPYFVYRAHYGFGNGLLMTGDQGYVDTWRGVIENVNANAKVSGGQTLYPHMHGDDGWYDYTSQPFSAGAMEVFYWSMDRADLPRVQDNDWVQFLEGQNPDYPVVALQEDLAEVRERTGKGTRRQHVARYAHVGRHERLQPCHGQPLDRTDARRPAHRAAGISTALPGALLRSGAAAGRHARRCRRLGREHERRRYDADAGQHGPGGGAHGRRPGRRLRRASVSRRDAGSRDPGLEQRQLQSASRTWLRQQIANPHGALRQQAELCFSLGSLNMSGGSHV